MIFWLAPAHLALTIIILIWDIVLAGRIAQLRQAPPVFQAITGMAAMLLLPAVLLQLATSTIITGRAVAVMDWLWPAVLVLFAVQATYAVARRFVNNKRRVPRHAFLGHRVEHLHQLIPIRLAPKAEP